VKHEVHGKPHALQLVNTKSNDRDPIEVAPVQNQHHSCHDVYVLLHPTETGPDHFCLTVVNDNKVFYVGIDGLSTQMQLLRVWQWRVGDEVQKNNIKKEKKVRKPHAPKSPNAMQPEDVANWLVITDIHNQWVLCTCKSDNGHNTIVFRNDIPSNLFDAVFLAAPQKSFVKAYHHLH
jgi:hypothetical protein